jgi:tetratricopeptide (TPR) repeat protein
MHIALIGELGEAGLQLPSRRSVLRYLGDTTSVAEIARQQSADAVLEGWADYGEDSVQVTLQMTDAGSGGVRWSETFRAPTPRLAALRRDVIRAIVDAVDLQLTAEAEERLVTVSDVDPRSQELALRANYHLRRLTPQDLEVAEGLFHQALEIDPDNPLALGGLAWVWAGRQQFGMANPVDARPLILDYQSRALALAPNEPALVSANALILTWVAWDWEAAGREFERAIALNPNHWETRAYYSHYLVFMGRYEEARAQAELARAGDPFSGLTLGVATGTFGHLGEFEFALEAGREALRLDPTQPVAHDVVTGSLRGLGRMEEAVRWSADLFSAVGDTALANAMLRGLDEVGPEEAWARAAEILEARAEVMYVSPVRIALAHEWAGDVEGALDWLERGEEIRDPAMPYMVGCSVTPSCQPVASHPRYQAILERMGLPER